MSPQETQLLQNFLAQLVQVQGVSKDAQADSLISAALGRQPDAGYLLVQRALLLEQALAAANSQLASLQADLRELRALQAATGSAGFLDAAAGAWGNSASSRPLHLPAAGAPAAPASISATSPQTAPGYAAAAAPSGFLGGGNMLGTVAATAAGVAAGAFLFQGLGHLLESGAAHAGGGAAQLNQGDGGLIPGYFDQEQAASPDDSADSLG